MLNSNYFKLITHRQHQNEIYYFYQPVGTALFLFSKIDGSPLASIHLKCQEGQPGRALITKRPYVSPFPCDFQGLIDQDNQEFELIISNLTSEGYVNINIMKCNTHVEDTDPGAEKGGLNQVNEIRPFESYAIKCDQKDNRVLLLKGLTKESGEKLTVKEAEEKKETRPEGTYYYLSVLPRKDLPTQIAKFKETEWRCVDLFYLKRKAPTLPSSACVSEGSMTLCSFEDDEPDSVLSESHSRGGFTIASSRNSGCESSAMTIIPASAPSKRFSHCESLFAQDDDYGVTLACASIDSNTEMCHQRIIQDSQAATVEGGRTIHVSSNKTGVKYEYDVGSNQHGKLCCLGLSISPHLEFRPDQDIDALIIRIEEIMKLIVEKSEAELRDFLVTKPIFDSKDCVICLEAEPNTVLYQCGHKCGHYDCISKVKTCPLCRNHIAGLIKV